MIARPKPGWTSNQSATVEHDVEDAAHVVDLAVVAGDDVEQLGGRPRCRLGRRPPRTAGTTTRSTGSTTGSGGSSSSAAASSAATLWISPLGDRDRRARRGPPSRRPRRVDSFTTGGPAVKIARRLGHHAEVRHRRDQRAVAGRRAHARRHHGDPTGALRLREQVGRGAAAVRTSGGSPAPSSSMTSGIRSRQGELGDAVALRVAARPDRPGEGGEVLGADHDRPAVDRALTRDDARRPARRHRPACPARGTVPDRATRRPGRGRRGPRRRRGGRGDPGHPSPGTAHGGPPGRRVSRPSRRIRSPRSVIMADGALDPPRPRAACRTHQLSGAWRTRRCG